MTKNTFKSEKPKEPGIEYPADFSETNPEQKPVEPVTDPTPVVEPVVPAVTEKPTQAVELKRSQLVTWTQALTALPNKLSEMKVESKRVTIELGFAAQIIQGNGYLQKCTGVSIYDAVIFAARIGITLNPASGLAYLVPRGDKCCLDIGYKGWRASLVTYGAIQHIDGYVVYEGEEFSWRPDLNELHHVPQFAKTEAEQKERKVYGAYARAVLPNGLVVFEFIPEWELKKIKAVSPAASKGFSPYSGWEGEMIRKAPIKRLAKKLQVLQDDDRVRAMFENEQNNDNLNDKKRTAPDWDVTEAEVIP